MTEAEYNQLCEDRTDLKLPPYHRLLPSFRWMLEGWKPEQLIAGRTSALLVRNHPNESAESPDGADFIYV